MKTTDAYLFLAVGLFMRIAPLLAPEYFPATGPGLSSGSALWLVFMGWVNSSVGAVTIVRNQVLPLVDQLLAWPPRLAPDASDAILHPPLPIEIQLQLHEEALQRAVA